MEIFCRSLLSHLRQRMLRSFDSMMLSFHPTESRLQLRRKHRLLSPSPRSKGKIFRTDALESPPSWNHLPLTLFLLLLLPLVPFLHLRLLDPQFALSSLVLLSPLQLRLSPFPPLLHSPVPGMERMVENGSIPHPRIDAIQGRPKKKNKRKDQSINQSINEINKSSS